MQIVDGPDGLEEVLSGLEMVIMEEVVALREAKKKGMVLSPAEIAAGYLSPKCSSGQELSPEHHTVGLACMVAVALHWLVCLEA